VYPRYVYFPRWQAAPSWVDQIVNVFFMHQHLIDTATEANKSDAVLHILKPQLETIGFQVEGAKPTGQKLHRPVFFGDNGQAERRYEIDAYHPDERIALEVEAGRSTMGNAIYRDIVQISLMVGVDYGVVAAPVSYRYENKKTGKVITAESYKHCRSILDAIYGGRRLELPLKGFLLIGY
jgi:hypothetical protein